MERMERVNSSYDLEYDYYRKNLPAIEDSEDTEESMILYEKIFESRQTFTILGLDSYIILSKKSLNKIASMINCHPQEYVLFTNHKIIDEDKFGKLLEKENGELNPINIPEPENNNDIYNDNDVNDDGFKKVENLDYKIINIEIFTTCLWLYLALVVCSFWNFLFYIYILARTKYGFNYLAIYIIILFGLLLFTGIYGFLKCRWRDFSGYILKIFTLAVPLCVLIEIIMYYSSSIKIKYFWVKLVIDILTIIIGIALILYLYGLIKSKKGDLEDEIDSKEGLLNSEKEAPVYKF